MSTQARHTPKAPVAAAGLKSGPRGLEPGEAHLNELRPRHFAPQRSSVVSNEVNEQAFNLTLWEQEYNQCSAGHFAGRVDECCFDGVQVIDEYTNLALHQHCAPWPNSLWVGIADQREGVRIDGQCAGKNDVLWRMGSRAFELMTPGHCHILSMVVRLDDLFALAEREGADIRHLNHTSVPRLQTDEQQIGWFAAQVARVLQASVDVRNATAQKEELLYGVLGLLDHARPNASEAPSYTRRRAVVNRVQAFLKSAGEEPVSIAKLCSVACVSRRTLQYSFESILGASPIQFLRATRLNCVRRQLLSHREMTISEAAASQGFFHLSQFAMDYKSLFNERPSDTLKRQLH